VIFLGIFVLIASGLLFVTVFNQVFKLEPNQTKYTGIEGLRGFLAFFVFVHHYSSWYGLMHTVQWSLIEPVAILARFGKHSVFIFFMITGFLFFDKLFRNEPINWSEFLWKRIFRLFPLYFLSILVVIFYVLLKTNFELTVSKSKLLEDSLNWIAFGFIKCPAINNDGISHLTNSGVHWTLSFEVFFYLSLPLFAAVFFKKQIPLLTAFICASLCYFFLTKRGFNTAIFKMFIYGILVAFVNFKIKNTGLSIKSKWIGFAGILLFYSVFNDKFANENLDICALFLLFFIIVRGNSILGVLNWKSSQILGQLSYSVYLIHGLVIYTLNTFIIPKSYILSLSKTNYMFLGIVYCSAIIFVSFLTHIYIELPGNKLITHIRNIMPKMEAELNKMYTKAITIFNK
jgi:peptidoglycan/LPS O-acetylase OafA/YrhL